VPLTGAVTAPPSRKQLENLNLKLLRDMMRSLQTLIKRPEQLACSETNTGALIRLLGWLRVSNGRSLADACRNVLTKRNTLLLTSFSENPGGGVSKFAFLFHFRIFGGKMAKRRRKGARKGTRKG
jgi:hypothetical protein